MRLLCRCNPQARRENASYKYETLCGCANYSSSGSPSRNAFFIYIQRRHHTLAIASCSYCHHFGHRHKDLFIVDTVGLRISFDNKSCFVIVEGLISIVLHLIYPSIIDQFSLSGTWNLFPCDILD